MSSGSGVRTVGVALVVVALLAGLGAWNYQRNLRAERASPGATPFRGYSDADLAALRGAYEAEIATLRTEYDAASKRRAAVRPTQGVGEGIAEFERVRRSSERVRDAGQELAAQEKRVQEIAAEQARRARTGSEIALHVRRLTGLELPL
ncbi:MAG: hypothetical protein R3E88_19780 [Myxococcota bacterium]|nr:hypothetical protein [Myxococcales bacterium]